jgi:hypothetical protein
MPQIRVKDCAYTISSGSDLIGKTVVSTDFTPRRRQFSLVFSDGSSAYLFADEDGCLTVEVGTPDE